MVNKTAARETQKAGAELEAFARSLGAEIYGVASAEAYLRDFPTKPPPTKFVPDAKSVIIVGMPFSPAIYATVARPEMAEVFRKPADPAGGEKAVNRPPAGAERYYSSPENTMLQHEVAMIGYKVGWKLLREGYAAFYMPNVAQEPRFRTAPFYFMPAMYEAGLGQLGYNCAIINPEYGPRFRVTAIITNKELPAGQPLGEQYYPGCAECKMCVRRCPAKAIDGKGWKNVFACAAYGCCGTCISVCPVGKWR
ncbi:MAG: epoxyqueuosine reductase [Chloroflexi bacterium]|nr:epoxyqueuosine reductase [Chloroflexota bacterium]